MCLSPLSSKNQLYLERSAWAYHIQVHKVGGVPARNKKPKRGLCSIAAGVSKMFKREVASLGASQRAFHLQHNAQQCLLFISAHSVHRLPVADRNENRRLYEIRGQSDREGQGVAGATCFCRA